MGDRRPRPPKTIRYQQIAYHRNGITGNGYFVLDFTYEGVRLFAVVPSDAIDENPEDETHQRQIAEAQASIAVFDPHNLDDAKRAADWFGPAAVTVCREWHRRKYAHPSGS